MLAGETQAWDILAGLSPEDVCTRAQVTFDGSSRRYTLRSFRQDIFVSPEERGIAGCSPVADLLLNKLGHFSRLPILWYLINAKDIPLSGELRRPSDLSGGQIYLQGSHVLPLDGIAQRYGSDISGFLSRGRELGGESLSYGDASIRLFPFPRVPVTVVLWKGDDEFASRCTLLLDSTCEVHLPADVLWETTMLSVLVML